MWGGVEVVRGRCQGSGGCKIPESEFLKQRTGCSAPEFLRQTSLVVAPLITHHSSLIIFSPSHPPDRMPNASGGSVPFQHAMTIISRRQLLTHRAVP
eukprot:scaffold43275_cov67-Cyclotella_meneghiniana.AAC.8